MKTLIVGGTGSIGGYIALELERQSHEVTLAARNKVKSDNPLGHFPMLLGSYIEGDFTRDQLAGYDNLIFAACNDLRQVPPDSSEEQEAAYFRKANSEAVPRFISLAREAGIKRCAYIGSFYAQARPDLVAGSSYIQSRVAADEGARALANEDFRVVSLNASWVVGTYPGAVDLLYGDLARFSRGDMPAMPLFAPPGGVNFVSVHSVCEAAIASLTKGKNGRGYLVGDQNLHFKDILMLFFQATGRGEIDIPVRDEPHPLWPDETLAAGRAGTIFFKPEGVEELGYRQNDITRIVKHIVDVTP